MSSRTYHIVGNWKMNGSQAANAALLAALAEQAPAIEGNVRLVVCPPSVYLTSTVGQVGAAIAVGAQDCSDHLPGAFTGEVSAGMLKESGVSYVILGHSERRQYHLETDEQVCAKALRALEAGLIPILCVGETLAQREAGQTESVVSKQTQALIPALAKGACMVAYEPVWAIGTGRTATPEQAQEVHAQIRHLLTEALGAEQSDRLPVLYGGSMKAANAAALLACQDIDGGLVGGASLDANEFLAIARAVPSST